MILDEISMHGDDPGELAAEAVAAEIFGRSGSVARHRIGGLGGRPDPTADRESLEAALSARCLVVAAAGKVDHDRLVDRLSALDAEPSTSVRPLRGASTISRRGGLLMRRLPLEQCSAVLAFPALASSTHGDFRWPALLDHRRRDGVSAVCRSAGAAGTGYSIDAGETAYSDAGLWSVEWQCAPGKLAQILELVRATLADVAAHGVTEDELARAKGQMRGQTALSYEGPGSRMSRLGVNAILGDERTLGEMLRCFDEVTADQVRAEAEVLFTHPPTLAIAGPGCRPGESSRFSPSGRTELSAQLAIVP